ncbi:CBF-domain-containing protein [Aulographum hederae CBS 113979]|uniref:CBF-domain-containing protein n=1 Tax=Aulographum hederae CBS 113979 TaxID=1176131 RepID=A0A6G1GQ35_9PEZI|nr:CBF-domain-containing protein [Aulographum hederae CBS 113979]
MKRKAEDYESGGRGNWKAERDIKSKKPKQDREKKPFKHENAKAKLLFEPRPDWHAADLQPLAVSDDISISSTSALTHLQEYASSLLQEENALYTENNLSASSSHKFLSTIMSSGTLEDKVSALTLLVQESPLHTMKALENLLALAKKRSRNQALMAIAALKDMISQGALLPADRKLRAFGKQPALLSALQGEAAYWRRGQNLPGGIQKVHLIVWAYEDWLKKAYFDLLQTIEGWCNDEIEYARSRAVTFVFELLKEKPEQEENLLRLLVNKLGDNEKKIASRASYLLLQLQITHPAMKSTIINAIESDSLFRPGQSAHARYYAVITLNQTILSSKDEEVANKLLEVYFSLFVTLLKITQPRKGDTGDKVQGGGGKPGKKALEKAKKKEKAMVVEQETGERIVAQVLTGVNRAFPFAKTDDEQFEKQLNTIFRVTHSANFNTAIQALILIQQISAAKHYSADRFYQTLYESLLDPRLLTSSKQILYLNLLYRSLKTDISVKRVKAFVKRLLQVISIHEPPFVCGVLYLISELQNTFPSIKAMFDQPEDDDDDVEHFVDAEDPETVPNAETTHPDRVKNIDVPKKELSSNAYDPRKQNPELSNADRTCAWELLPLQTHFHPSVSLFASRLLTQEPMPPKPDADAHTLIHFLDRWAYRGARAKTSKNMRGQSLMQPLAGANTADRLITATKKGAAEQPVNSVEFWEKMAKSGGGGVREDEVFFQKYFERKPKGRKERKKEEKEKKGDSDEDEDSDAGEAEIWKALVGSRPEIEGDDDDEGFDAEDMDGMMSDDDNGIDVGGMDDEDDADAGVELNLDSDPGSEDEVDAAADDASSEGDFNAADLDDGDEDAMFDSDEEVDVPATVGFDEGGSDEEFEGFDDGDEKAGKDKDKGGKKSNKERRQERKKLKQLPVFASVEDYERLLGGEEDGM